jgi:hypothetical protein
LSPLAQYTPDHAPSPRVIDLATLLWQDQFEASRIIVTFLPSMVIYLWSLHSHVSTVTAG